MRECQVPKMLWIPIFLSQDQPTGTATSASSIVSSSPFSGHEREARARGLGTCAKHLAWIEEERLGTRQRLHLLSVSWSVILCEACRLPVLFVCCCCCFSSAWYFFARGGTGTPSFFFKLAPGHSPANTFPPPPPPPPPLPRAECPQRALKYRASKQSILHTHSLALGDKWQNLLVFSVTQSAVIIFLAVESRFVVKSEWHTVRIITAVVEFYR